MPARHPYRASGLVQLPLLDLFSSLARPHRANAELVLARRRASKRGDSLRMSAARTVADERPLTADVRNEPPLRRLSSSD